jgi:hypothetical protein
MNKKDFVQLMKEFIEERDLYKIMNKEINMWRNWFLYEYCEWEYTDKEKELKIKKYFLSTPSHKMKHPHKILNEIDKFMKDNDL